MGRTSPPQRVGIISPRKTATPSARTISPTSTSATKAFAKAIRRLLLVPKSAQQGRMAPHRLDFLLMNGLGTAELICGYAWILSASQAGIVATSILTQLQRDLDNNILPRRSDAFAWTKRPRNSTFEPAWSMNYQFLTMKAG